MRKVLFDLLFEEMKRNDRMFLIVADMGMGIFEEFKERFPRRCINVGIAEQNMVGVAAGLCNAGFRPFCYTLSNFLTQRCFEQIRNDICIPGYPATLIGTSTGFDNGTLGATHHPVDDIGLMKILPGMRVYSPSANEAVDVCFNDIITDDKPAYMRLGKGSLLVNRHLEKCDFFVQDNPLKPLIITHGISLGYILKKDYILDRCSILCINKLKNVDKDLVTDTLNRYKTIIVFEEQFASCGLYNILCQFMIENNITGVCVKSVCPDEEYSYIVGNSEYFSERYRYAEKIINFIDESEI